MRRKVWMYLTGLRLLLSGLRRALTARALLLIALVAVVACGGGNGGGASTSGATSGAARAQKRVTFMAGFKAQANLPFVGVYVAQEKGFFRQEALDVDIRHAQSG